MKIAKNQTKSTMIQGKFRRSRVSGIRSCGANLPEQGRRVKSHVNDNIPLSTQIDKSKSHLSSFFTNKGRLA
jgi:hypothetical protein